MFVTHNFFIKKYNSGNFFNVLDSDFDHDLPGKCYIDLRKLRLLFKIVNNLNYTIIL